MLVLKGDYSFGHYDIADTFRYLLKKLEVSKFYNKRANSILVEVVKCPNLPLKRGRFVHRSGNIQTVRGSLVHVK
jgi:hypothetical protein